MQIQNYRPIQKGFLLGKFDIVVEKWGMTIHDCLVFQKEAQRWISLPTREYLKDDQKKHYPLIKFNDEIFRRLQKSALDQIEMILATKTFPATNNEQQFQF